MKCKKELKVAKLARLMSSFNDDVSRAIFTLNRENVNTHLIHFTTILIAMEGYVQHPCKNFIICQQVISQCYGILGNMSTVTNDVEDKE